MALNTKSSVVDLMKSKGMDSSYSNRTKLANQYGIKDYKGTAQQNQTLMGKITAPPQQTTNTKASLSNTSASVKANATSGSNTAVASQSANKGQLAGAETGSGSQPNKTSNGKGGVWSGAGGTGATPNAPTDTTGMTEEDIAKLIQDSMTSNNESLMNNFNQMFQGGQQGQNDLMNMMMTMMGQGGMGGQGDWQNMYGQMQSQFQQLQEQLAYFKMLQQYYQTYQGQGNSMKYSPFM